MLLHPKATGTIVNDDTPPTITGFTPIIGKVNTTVTITGTHFVGVTAVAFNGTKATTFSIVHDTKITAKVPKGALTGAVSVSKPSGTATGGTFIVKPVISKFTPITGPVGTVVTITGTAFTGATSVMFNTTAAVPTSVSYSKIVVPVPAGATTGKIFVTTPSGTAASVAVFTVA